MTAGKCNNRTLLLLIILLLTAILLIKFHGATLKAHIARQKRFFLAAKANIPNFYMEQKSGTTKRFTLVSNPDHMGTHEWQDNCTCKGEIFCFRTKIGYGVPFSCEYYDMLKNFGLLCNQYQANEEEIDKDKPKIRYRTIVTGTSANHFAEFRSLMINLRNYTGTNSKLVFFDLGGLSESQIGEVKSLCNAEYRKFNFNEYPNYVRSLKQYRWKPFIIATMYKELDNFWWWDASVRFTKYSMTAPDFPFAMQSRSKHSIFAGTLKAIYDYFPISKSQSQKTQMYGGGLLHLKKTKRTTEYLKWWVLCAIEKNCMSPPGARQPCNFWGSKFLNWAGCHRFDQSAINLIVAPYFDFNETAYVLPIESLDVRRGQTSKVPLKENCSTNA